jgi:arabinose-5-phosphate isomerase
MMLNRMDRIEAARTVLAIEIEALTALRARLNSDFERAIDFILAARGRVVVLGMGKSGIIGRKIAATFASTGTPAFFVHPGEAFHGDLGMIRPEDVALMISNSGETEELVRLIPFLQHQRNVIIAMVGRIPSTLARVADIALDISVEREACANNLAPTSSTTAALAMGDALAVVASTARAFQPEDFARFHPGGAIGRRLLTRVKDVMRREALPFCAPDAGFGEIVQIVSRGRLGLAIITEDGALRGVITDGDIRRTIERTANPMSLTARQIMTPTPVTIDENERFAVAEEIMRQRKINSLIVLNAEGAITGVAQIYDL